MEARELRIGNWVTRNVTGVEGDGYLYKIANGYDIDNVEHFEPIPLSPEILEKCGFEKNRYSLWFHNGLKSGTLYTEALGAKNTLAWIEKGEDEYVQEIDIEPLRYLHQLQNLYYALTNTELPITL